MSTEVSTQIKFLLGVLQEKKYKDMYIQLVLLYIPIYAWCLFGNDF